MKIYFFLVSVFLLMLVSRCNKPVNIESKWTDSEIPFNADSSQWKGVMQYPDNPQFGIGFKNDGRFLYLRAVSWNDSINKQILRFGFTTWFTSPSKNGKRFGIHFPIARRRTAEERRADRENKPDSAEVRARWEESLQEMEFLGPENNDSIPVKTKVAESMDIVVGLFPSQENLIYEMKIPLREDSVCKYAIDIGKDSVLKVAFESDVPEIGTHGQGESHGGGAGGGGKGGGGGMSGGGGRGMHGGGGGMRGGGGGGHEHAAEAVPEQFKASFSVELATKFTK
jgi:hypothetical protein